MASMTKVVVSLTDYEAETILTTAVEGGIGYWSAVGECTRRLDKTDPDYLSWQSVELWDAEDTSEFLGTVNKGTIEKGVAALVNGDVRITSDLQAQVMTLFAGETWMRDGESVSDFDIDSSAADCIVQAGLFGEIVYG